VISSSIDPTLGFRAPFGIVVIPTFILAPLFLCTRKNAAGGKVSQSFYDQKITWAKVKKLADNRTVILGYLQGIPSAIPFAVFFSFSPTFLVEVVGGISVQQTVLVVLSFGADSIIGQILSGYISDYLWKKRWNMFLYTAA